MFGLEIHKKQVIQAVLIFFIGYAFVRFLWWVGYMVWMVG